MTSETEIIEMCKKIKAMQTASFRSLTYDERGTFIANLFALQQAIDSLLIKIESESSNGAHTVLGQGDYERRLTD